MTVHVSLTRMCSPYLSPNPTFEFAIEDAFAPPQGGTIRVYTTWQSVVNGGQYVTLPSIFQQNEGPIPGFVMAEQIFLCGNGGLFCDNYAVGGGTLIGQQTFTGLGTAFPMLTKLSPGQPLSVTEVFTVAQNRCC